MAMFSVSRVIACAHVDSRHLAVRRRCLVRQERGARPEQPLPFGYLDLPAEGAMVPAGKPLQVAGWALDDSTVKEVRVYLDNRFKAKTSTNLERPDLAKPYPSYLHGTNMHGWNVEIDVPNGAGPHTILVQVVDDGGATRDVRPASIIVQ